MSGNEVLLTEYFLAVDNQERLELLAKDDGREECHRWDPLIANFSAAILYEY